MHLESSLPEAPILPHAQAVATRPPGHPQPSYRPGTPETKGNSMRFHLAYRSCVRWGENVTETLGAQLYKSGLRALLREPPETLQLQSACSRATEQDGSPGSLRTAHSF